MSSDRQSIVGYSINAVSLEPASIDAAAGTVALRWSQFRDPGFRSYQVLRRRVGSDEEIELVILEARADTSFVDDSALHEVSYSYSVSVQTITANLTGVPVESTESRGRA